MLMAIAHKTNTRCRKNVFIGNHLGNGLMVMLIIIILFSLKLLVTWILKTWTGSFDVRC